MANLNSNGTPVVFTRGSMVGITSKVAILSPAQYRRKQFNTVVVEKDGKIIVKEGICATAILTKALCGEYSYTIHWPELSKHHKPLMRRNGHDPHLVVVLSDEKGDLYIKKGDEAVPILAGRIPSGFEIEFIPPQKRKKKTN